MGGEISFGLLPAVVAMSVTTGLFAYVGFRCVRLSFVLDKAQIETLVCMTERGKPMVFFSSWSLLCFGLFLWLWAGLLVTILIMVLG